MSYLPGKKIKLSREEEFDKGSTQGGENFRGNNKLVVTKKLKGIEAGLKYLAPVSVVDANEEWPKPVMSPVNTRVNEEFKGGRTREMGNVCSDYYKFNTNSHFVWTNRLVVGKDVEIENEDCFLNCDGNENIEGANYNNCNLKSPHKSFQLKKLKDDFGHGLFAKHLIKKGSFNHVLFS